MATSAPHYGAPYYACGYNLPVPGSSRSFKSFDIILSPTKGGPYNSTQSVALNIYNEAFQNNHYGLGTAKSLIFFIVVALLTSLQVTLTKKREVQA